MKKGWYWPFLLGLLLASGVGANLYFMARALGDPSFAVEPDYYAKGVAWDAHQAQERKNAELGWTLAMSVAGPDIGSGKSHVVATLKDRDGRAVQGLVVELQAFHNARAADVVKATLEETGEHLYAADAAIVRPGLWEFRVVASRGAQRFTAVLDQDAPGVSR